MSSRTCDCDCQHSSSFFSGIIFGVIIGAIIAIIIYRQNKGKVVRLLQNKIEKFLKNLNSSPLSPPKTPKKKKNQPPKVFVRRTK